MTGEGSCRVRCVSCEAVRTLRPGTREAALECPDCGGCGALLVEAYPEAAGRPDAESERGAR